MIGLNVFIFQAIVGPLALISSVSAAAAPLFIIPFMLLLLALGMLAVTVWSWRKSGWSIWNRLYYTFLAVCVMGYVAMLAATGMLSVLV